LVSFSTDYRHVEKRAIVSAREGEVVSRVERQFLTPDHGGA
jgi:hypothetical protein